jgi:hypothetical protein
MRPLTNEETELINKHIPAAVAKANREMRPLKAVMKDNEWKANWNIRYLKEMNTWACELELRRRIQ